MNMKQHIKQCYMRHFAVLILCVLICSLVFSSCTYTSTDSSDYMNFGGRNAWGEARICAYFPEKLTEDFKNVDYYYKDDSWMYCEVYLEFTFDDKEAFHNHVEKATRGLSGKPFHYDGNYQEYVLSDVYSSGERYVCDILKMETRDFVIAVISILFSRS